MMNVKTCERCESSEIGFGLFGTQCMKCDEIVYHRNILDLFTEDQMNYGLSAPEVQDLIEEHDFSYIEKFLSKRYNLEEYK